MGNRITNRLRFWWRRERLYGELQEELDFHKSMADSHQMGNVAAAVEDSWNTWGFLSIERLIQDLRFSLRMFVRSPLFTLVAVVSLALGIGGNAAVFSLMDHLLVRPLPYAEPDRLIQLTSIYPRAALPALRLTTRTMELGAASLGEDVSLTEPGPAIRVVKSLASTNLFSLLGTNVAIGRSFEPGEDSKGRDQVAILSNELWRKQFYGDPSVVGRMVKLDGVDRQIIGVMPAGFAYPSSRVQVWVPLRMDSSNFIEYWGGPFVPFIARLRPGVSLQLAQNEVASTVAEFRKSFPYPMSSDWNPAPSATPLQQAILGDSQRKIYLLFGCVAVVLLIACANVASLLLARAMTRRKEIALRSALGAGRLRIVRQLLTESALLSTVGAVVGTAFAKSILSIFRATLPATTPGLSAVTIDWRVVAGTGILALTTGIVCGLAPALSASQVSLTESVKSSAQRLTPTWNLLRTWLIGGEIALTVLLVVCAGLLGRSLYQLSTERPGFEADHLLTLRITPDDSFCRNRATCSALYDRVLSSIQQQSDVDAVALTSSVPLDNRLTGLPVEVEDHPPSPSFPAPLLSAVGVSPNFTQLLHIPLLAGRDFTVSDSLSSEPVLLISASTARKYWPGENAVGKHIRASGEPHWRRIVGVVGDVKQFRLSRDFPDGIAGGIYMPYPQAIRENGQMPTAMTLVISPNSAGIDAGRIRKLVEAIAPNTPVGEVETMQGIVTASIADFRSTIRLFICFAAAAIILAAIGIYGLISYWVSQRTYEIGVRVALGATRAQVFAMVLRQGLAVTLWGVGIGSLAALAVTRLLASLLYSVKPVDPATFAAAGIMILGIALASTAPSAWRALRIDPVRTLRWE